MTRIHYLTAMAVLLTGAAVASLSTPSPAAAQQQEADHAAIRAAHRQLREAAEKLDATALYARVLDTSTPPIIEDGVLFGTHATALENTRRGLGALSRISYHYAHEHITTISKDVALWVADGTATATLQDGRELAAPFAETIVFARKDGEWRVLHAHRSAPNTR